MLSRTLGRSTTVWLAALAAAAVYAVMWLGYRHDWAWLTTADSRTLDVGYDVGTEHPAWVRFWDFVCTLFAPATFRLLAMVAAAIAVVRRHLRNALFFLISVEPSGFISQLAKDLADRPRPDTALVAAASSSFPSGHALGAMVGVAALLTVVLPTLGRTARIAALAAGVLIVVAVGLGRVALNVHHLSDVLAGWSLGYLYVAVCALVLLRR